ncbi:unnamed protein product [Rhizophagus irregularis]|uniref:Uncharacterized protein n=1 Tax=Rhizophagus irregularis TaxID=588596 RepID=A0A2N1NGY3_9GLOM|nr:hypothetical protein RhiirC2_352556 [Rhizophagus irregularis]CAB5388366.1 unnamed protein product [Rhizophagus irregularis]
MSRTRYSSLFYEGYIYDGYLYTLALQLIEDAYYIDPAVLTIEEKQSMVKQLESNTVLASYIMIFLREIFSLSQKVAISFWLS